MSFILESIHRTQPQRHAWCAIECTIYVRHQHQSATIHISLQVIIPYRPGSKAQHQDRTVCTQQRHAHEKKLGSQLIITCHLCSRQSAYPKKAKTMHKSSKADCAVSTSPPKLDLHSKLEETFQSFIKGASTSTYTPTR